MHAPMCAVPLYDAKIDLQERPGTCGAESSLLLVSAWPLGVLSKALLHGAHTINDSSHADQYIGVHLPMRNHT